jgi:hypothetical protein
MIDEEYTLRSSSEVEQNQTPWICRQAIFPLYTAAVESDELWTGGEMSNAIKTANPHSPVLHTLSSEPPSLRLLRQLRKVKIGHDCYIPGSWRTDFLPF